MLEVIRALKDGNTLGIAMVSTAAKTLNTVATELAEVKTQGTLTDTIFPLTWHPNRWNPLLAVRVF